MVPCTNAKHGCHFESLRGDQQRHLADCVARAVKCKHCSAFFPKNKIAVHDNKCLEVPVRCPNAFKGCNVKNLTRGGSAGHVLVCGWAADKCTAVGCGVVLLKKDMEKHMLESVEEHQQSLQCFVADLEKKVVALGRDNDLLRMKCLASKHTFEVQVLQTSGKEQPAKSALYKFGSGVTGVAHAYTEQYAEGTNVYVELGITPTQREWRAHVRALPPPNKRLNKHLNPPMPQTPGPAYASNTWARLGLKHLNLANQESPLTATANELAPSSTSACWRHGRTLSSANSPPISMRTPPCRRDSRPFLLVSSRSP
ncbi:hypothetical protein T484DRAFT_3630678 [Baffinella frigidus]|nr:hypothetical protein T484DRAFT_3630678 [Cryptophyta sp. CCMP2293]